MLCVKAEQILLQNCALEGRLETIVLQIDENRKFWNLDLEIKFGFGN